MTHPDSKQTIDRSDDEVATYTSQGWVVKAEKKADDSK